MARFAATVAALVLAACLSPTLPLPPPDAPDFMAPATEAGSWRIGGSNTAGATVFVQNERTGVIVGREDDEAVGSYLLTIEAERCDTAAVFELVGEHVSDRSYFIVRETVNGVPQDAPCVAPPP